MEVAQCFDLRNGAPCAAAVAIPGPLAGMRYSPDGSRVLHWRANELVLRDARSLAPAAETPGLLPEGDAVTDARLSPDGKVLYAGIQSDRMASHVLRVELRAPGSPTRFPQGAIPIAVMPLHGDSGVAVQLYESKGVSQLLPDGQELALPYDRKLRYGRAMAASADGTMLAIGLRDGVILTDAASAQALAPPLRFAFSAPDAVQQLAFSPDGESIAARTVFGRWLVWNLRRDARSADTIAAEAALLHPGAEQRRQLPAAALAPELRAELRKRDPGPPEPATAPPPTSCVAAVPTGFPRSPAASSELLDLQPHYNQSPREHTPDLSFGFTRLCALPLGVQRFLGVDYDVRGTIALAFDAPVRAGAPRLRKVEGIALPHPRFVALNVLATSAASLSDPSLRPAILNVVLRYRDGSVERLPLRWRLEVQRSGDLQPGPRIAWFGETTGTEVSEYHWREGSFAARLENPHPERDALALDLEATDVTWSAPVVLAISLETTESRAAAGAGPSRP